MRCTTRFGNWTGWNVAEEPKIKLALDGVRYEVGPSDFTATDDLEMFRATGVTIMDVFAKKAISLFSVAALLWRYRVNHGEPKLTFSDVADAMTFDSLSVADDDDEGTPSPEA